MIFVQNVKLCELEMGVVVHNSSSNNNNNNNNNNMEAVLGKHSIDSLQKTTLLGTSHIIRKVLQCET